MRWAVLGLLAAAWSVGCNDHPGTYVVLDGGIPFNQVEVYFGTAAGPHVPTTPMRLTPTTESQLLVRRAFLESDTPTRFDAATTTWTDFVPANDTNEALGDYMLAIGLMDGRPVAIGELFNFEVATGDTLYRYIVPLVPINQEDVERWGRPTKDCVRWTRAREAGMPTTVAVVHADDADCDGFLDPPGADGDCEPLLYCDGSGEGVCQGAAPCFGAEIGQCYTGTCINSDSGSITCQQQDCVETQLCEGCPAGDPESLLACALDNIGVHTDFGIAIGPSGALCSNPYELPITLPFPCSDPKIEASANFIAGNGMYGFAIAQQSGNVCALTITSPVPVEPFDAVPHVLMSVANAPGSPFARSLITFGLQASGGCPGTGISIEPDLGSCGM